MATIELKFLGLHEDSDLTAFSDDGCVKCDCDCYDCNTDNDHAAE